MRKFLALIAVCALSFTPAFSQSFLNTLNERNIFNHLGVSVHAATTGFGFELATPITNWVTMRVGGTFMPGFKFSTDVDGDFYNKIAEDIEGQYPFTVDVDASLKRSQGSLIFNIYPFGSRYNFFIAAGAYFGGSKILKITGHSDELEAAMATGDVSVFIGDYLLPVDENGNVRGGLKTKSFRPYLGLGFGRPVPNKRVSFMFELGVQFQGKMKAYTDFGDIEELPADYNDDDWQKWMDKLTVYPVVKFTLCGRII